MTANECDTTRSWVHTKPGTAETFHKEYQHKRSVEAQTKTVYSYKKVTPAVQGVKEFKYKKPKTKQVTEYKYKKPVKTYKTEYHFAKFTHTKEKPRYGSWGAYGPWTKWSPETHTSWETSNAPLGTPQQHGSGTYSNGTQWYREWQAQWDGQTRQVQTGTTYEYKDWTTEVLGSPWVKYDQRTTTVPDGYEYSDWTTEVRNSPWIKTDERWKVEPQPEKVEYSGERDTTLPSPWVLLVGYPKTETIADAYTEYYVTATTTTRDIDNAAWVTQPAIQGWTQFKDRDVSNNDATDPVVTYYAWTDGKECEVVTPTPTPTVTVTPVPPVVTPTPPVVEPPVKVKKVKKPRAKIRANCTGRVAYSLDNTKSNAKVTFKYLRNGKVTKVTVKAGKSKFFVKKAKARSVAWIKAKGMKTVKTRVPGACHVPHSGYRK